MSFHTTRSFFPHYEFSHYAFFLSPFPCLHGVHSFFHFSCVFMQHLCCAFTRTRSFFHLSYGFTVCILSFLRTRYFLSPFLCVPTDPFLVSAFSFSTLRALSFPFPVCSHCSPRFQLFYVFTLCFHTAFSHCFHIAFLHCVFRRNMGPRDFMKLSVTI